MMGDMMGAFRAILAYFGGRRIRDSGRWQLANLRRSYVFGAISRAELENETRKLKNGPYR
jgi:hypothetical protein